MPFDLPLDVPCDGPTVVILTRPMATKKPAPNWWQQLFLRTIVPSRVSELCLRQHELHDALMKRLSAAMARNEVIVIDPPPGSARLINNDLLWSAEQVLRAGSVAAALLWLPASTDSAQLRRLQLAAETGGTLAFLLQDARRLATASPAPLRLRLDAGRGDDGALLVHLVKRRGAPLDKPIRLPGVGGSSGTKTGASVVEVRRPSGRSADAGLRSSNVAGDRFQAAIAGARSPLPDAPHGKPLAAG